MATRDIVILSGNSLEDVKTEANFFLQRMTDRLDALEGIRGGTGAVTTETTVTSTADESLIFFLD